MVDPVNLSSYSFVLDLFILFCLYVWKEKMSFLLILALRKMLNFVFLCSIKKYCHKQNVRMTWIQSQVGWVNMGDPVNLSNYSFVLDLLILLCFFPKEKWILLILALRKMLNSLLQFCISLVNFKNIVIGIMCKSLAFNLRWAGWTWKNLSTYQVIHLVWIYWYFFVFMFER